MSMTDALLAELVERIRVASFEAPKAGSHTEWAGRLKAMFTVVCAECGLSEADHGDHGDFHESGERAFSPLVCYVPLDRDRKGAMPENELLVDTPNPAALDATLQQMGAVLVGGPADFVVVDGHYVVRAPGGGIGYIKFACETQGYAKVVAGPGNWTEPDGGG